MGIIEAILHAIAPVLALIATPALADVAGIASVIDGDTIEVHGQPIRLHGIDAPESRQLCRLDSNPWQCGKDAANALTDKIARQPVTCEDLGRDRYKRIIGRCIVAGEDINAWMGSQGLALAYRRYSLDYVDEEAGALRGRPARPGPRRRPSMVSSLATKVTEPSGRPVRPCRRRVSRVASCVAAPR